MTPVTLRLKQHRERAGLSQQELADAVDVRQATISDLETGKSRRIEFEFLDRLCAVLGVEPGELLERTQRRRKGDA